MISNPGSSSETSYLMESFHQTLSNLIISFRIVSYRVVSPQWSRGGYGAAVGEGRVRAMRQLRRRMAARRPMGFHATRQPRRRPMGAQGMVTTLRTRAAVFGVCNPKGGYDARQARPACPTPKLHSESRSPQPEIRKSPA